MRRRKGGGKDRDTQRRRGGRGQDRDRQQFRLEPGEEAGARGGALTTLQYSTGQATGQDGFPNQRERLSLQEEELTELKEIVLSNGLSAEPYQNQKDQLGLMKTEFNTSLLEL